METAFLVLVSLATLFFAGVVPLYIDNGRLLTLAGRLERSRVEQGAFRLLRRIDGTFRGRAVTLTITSGGQLDLRLSAPRLGPLTIRRQGLEGWLLASLRRNVHYVSAFQVEGPGEAAGRLAGALERVRSVEWPLKACLETVSELGDAELALRDGWLIAPRIRRVDIAKLMALLGYMAEVSERLADLAALNGRIRAVEGAALLCPFCRAAIHVPAGSEGEAGPGAGEPRACHACDTVHHAACWSENAGCSIFACAGGPSPERAARDERAPRVDPEPLAGS